MTSAAAKKAWVTRRSRHGVKHNPKTTEEIEPIPNVRAKRKGKKRKGRAWGPGNPLYDWKQKQK